MTLANPMFPPPIDPRADRSPAPLLPSVPNPQPGAGETAERIKQLEDDHDRAWREGRYSDCATIMVELIRLKGGRHPADRTPKRHGTHGFTTW